MIAQIRLFVRQPYDMKRTILKIAVLTGVIALVAALWPIFIEVETSLRTIYLIASAAGIGIAVRALLSKKRWLLWAALGIWPGAIAGGLVFAGIAFLTVNNGTTGWEGTIVAIVIIFGVFVGAIAGAITGGVLGARKTRRAGSPD